MTFALLGFCVSSPLSVEPVWVAAAGALVLATTAVHRRTITPWGVTGPGDARRPASSC